MITICCLLSLTLSHSLYFQSKTLIILDDPYQLRVRACTALGGGGRGGEDGEEEGGGKVER